MPPLTRATADFVVGSFTHISPLFVSNAYQYQAFTTPSEATRGSRLSCTLRTAACRERLCKAWRSTYSATMRACTPRRCARMEWSAATSSALLTTRTGSDSADEAMGRLYW